MKKKGLVYILLFVLICNVFQYNALAVSIVDATSENEKIYDVSDATAEGSGFRLQLNNYWQVADAPDTSSNIDANPFLLLNENDLATFKAQPTAIPWKSVLVPSDLSASANFKQAHRVFYHIKIRVPQTDIDIGRSFYFDFEGTNWIASVFVNDQLAGTKKSTRIPWRLDVSSKIVAGDNDIYIGMKSPRYAIDAVGTATMTGEFAVRKKLSNYFTPDFLWYGTTATADSASKVANLTKLKWNAPIYPTDKGGKDCSQFGLTDPVSFVSTGGKVYAQDVFVKTDVVDPTTLKISNTSKKISADITLYNSASVEKTVTVNMDCSLKGGAIEKNFDPQTVKLLPNSTKIVTVTGIPWSEAKLWSPNLIKEEAPIYNFDVSIADNTKTIHFFQQTFGFRDIKIDGKFFRINGVRRNFRTGSDGDNGYTSGEEYVAKMKAVNANYQRYGQQMLGPNFPGNPNTRQQLDVLDEYGVPITFGTMIDGMFASFCIVKLGVVNKIMFENFKENIEQTVYNYRNHPSIILYSLENELLFINVGNIFSQYITQIEKYTKTYMYDAAKALDPTRPAFTDGGCAGLNNTGAIYGTHYPETTDITSPSAPLTSLGATKGLWNYDNKRPYVAGETMYFTSPLSYHNWVGGESAANNQKESLNAFSKFVAYMNDFYRWNDAALVTYSTVTNNPDVYTSTQPLGIITKDYKTTFYANKGYSNEVKLINDTVNNNPITFKWTLAVNGNVVQSKSQDFTIEPGFSVVVPVKLGAVSGIVARTKGILNYEMVQQGSQSSLKTVELGIFPASTKIAVTKKVYTYHISTGVASALKSMGIQFTPVPKTIKIVDSMKKVKYYVKIKGKKVAKYKIVTTYKTVTLMSGSNLKYFIKSPTSILLVGNNGFSSASGEGDSRAAVLFARAGGRVVVLEQNDANMIYSGLESTDYWPAEIYKYSDLGNNEWQPNINFGQGFDRPILKGLQQSDLSFWNGGGRTSLTAWQNIPGAKNWVYAGPESKATTLFELPVDKGMVSATQLKVGQRIDVEPVAKVLLGNLLKNANAYSSPSVTVAILKNENANLTSMVISSKVKYAKVPSILYGLNAKLTKIFILQANKVNLSELLRQKKLVDLYTNAGGWVILWGLAPEALLEYNTLLGTQHIIRPFRKEATTSFSDSISIGLSTADYLLYNTKMIAPWVNLTQVSNDTFTYCVDATDNIAPFNDFEKEGFGNSYPDSSGFDSNRASMTNNLYNGDFWHYIWQVWVGGVPSWEQRKTPGATPGPLNLYTFNLPKTEKIDKVVFFNNKNYNALKGCTVSALGDDGVAILESQFANLPNSYDATEFKFNAPVSKRVNFKISSFYDNNGGMPMCGVDEIQIFRKTPQWVSDSKCTPLDSNGTLVKYPRGKGGVLLNNVKLSGFSSLEPETNLEFKAKIFSVFFQNMGAKFN